MAKKYKVPLELLGHAQQILHRAMYTYGEDAPCYSAPRMLEEALKTDLRCDDFKDWSYSIESVDGSSIIRHHGIKLDQSEEVNSIFLKQFAKKIFFTQCVLRKNIITL